MARGHRRQQFQSGHAAAGAGAASGAIINNQVEFHPLLDQSELLHTRGTSASRSRPIVRWHAARRLQPQVIQDIAARLGRPPSEVVLRWIIQQGVAAIPMTTKRENALSNSQCAGLHAGCEATWMRSSALGTQGKAAPSIPRGWRAAGIDQVAEASRSRQACSVSSIGRVHQLARRRSRPRPALRSRQSSTSRRIAGTSMTPSPIMPRSFSTSVVGTSQSQT